jgi:hypothetical protein
MSLLACNLNAIGETELPVYRTLSSRLREAITERRELSDGYAFRLNGDLVSLLDAARWVSLERLCCPFLAFRLEITGNDRDYWLTLSGPPDTKAIVRETLSSGPPKWVIVLRTSISGRPSSR